MKQLQSAPIVRKECGASIICIAMQRGAGCAVEETKESDIQLFWWWVPIILVLLLGKYIWNLHHILRLRDRITISQCFFSNLIFKYGGEGVPANLR